MKALIIFAKTPVLGKVKTRLQPHLAPEKILGIYKSFVRETVKNCAKLRGIDKFLGCAPTKDDDFLREISSIYKIERFNQKGKNLGDRITNAFKDYFKKGYKKVVVIGTDSPTIPVEYIRQAFHELNRRDFVIGPCCDGGYYLVGARESFPELFQGIPWDTSEVLDKTLEKLELANMRFSMLPFWYDVDTIDDLRFFKKHLVYLNRTKANFRLTL
ncbi:MAG: TIGR04282 family arsenosugar biosynthesis glycosyltransferase [Nitrospirae bacterium]|nr:TIGR04282 family arsenosugar biosynthesis glycosyltransferase [Nitrospirota bacterium]